MAYYTLHAYDADVWMPEFKGLQQSADMAYDLRYAFEVENAETPRGVLQPMAAQDIMQYSFEDRIETIARFHRRWYTGTGSKDWIVVAAGGKLYAKQEGEGTQWTPLFEPETLDAVPSGSFTVSVDVDAFRTKVEGESDVYTFTYDGNAWSPLIDEYGITIDGTPSANDTIEVTYVAASLANFQSSVWSCVTYEINPEGSEHPIDVLLMSNAKDGMIMVVPPDRPSIWDDYKLTAFARLKMKTWADIYSPKWNVVAVDTNNHKFGVIERHAERIWGCALADDPDMLVYSRPYDPTNWTPPTEDEEPEEGAGSIQQPTWNGDSFTALKTFGNQLTAWKGRNVWRVMGVSPGEYQFTEQYGGGTYFPNTLAIDVERILLVDKDGMSVYDGQTVSPFLRDYIEKFWKTVNRNAMDQMCAALFKHRYYLAVPTGDSEVNNALIVYNIEENSFLLYTDIYIESLLATEDNLYATTSTLPGKIMRVNYDSWETGNTTGKPVRWETPWMDFGRKTIAKGGYEIYFNPEVRNFPVTFRFSIQTEKKIKSKDITIQPTVDKCKQKRIRFGGTSRRFKLIIEALSLSQSATWRILGGIHMVVETDPD